MAHLPADIERILERARRADEPGAADRVRVGQALGAKLGMPRADWTSPPQLRAAPSSTAWSGWLSLKGFALLAALGAVAGGAWITRGSAPRARVEPNAVSPRPSVPPPTAGHELGSQAPAAPANSPALGISGAPAPTSERARATRPSTLQPSAAQRSASARPAAVAPGTLLATRSSRAPGNAALQPLAADANPVRAALVRRPRSTLGETAQPAPAVTSPLTESRPAPAPALQPSAAPSADPDSLARELKLLETASHRLDARNPQAALRLVSQHAAEYPHGSLVEERDALRIMALCDLGQRARAASLWRSFDCGAPHSPLRRRILAHCGPPGD